jgi:phospholipase/carboxylesterase
LTELVFQERPADGEPAGLIVLHHGRGADARDLLPLGDHLDPERRLHVAAPRAPLSLGGPGYHWYVVPRVGFPDPETFRAAYAQLTELHDRLWDRLGIEPQRTVLGGFSMGSVMSYALGLGPGRPAPAGILAFSGFVPTVQGWEPQVPRPTKVFIAHGRRDPIMDIHFAHDADRLLRDAGMEVEYHESDAAHWIDPQAAMRARDWLGALLAEQPQ